MDDDRVLTRVSSEAGDQHWVVHMTSGRHGLLADAPDAEGGSGIGPEPFTYVLAGLVACTSGTLRMFAEEHSIPLHHIGVDATMERGDDGRPVIRRTIRMVGDLDADERRRLLRAAEGTPVTRALRDGMTLATVEAEPRGSALGE